MGNSHLAAVTSCIFAILLPLTGCSPSSSKADPVAPALGVGVNFSEEKNYATCVENIQVNRQEISPDLIRDYTETPIKSQSELDEKVSPDPSARVKGFWGDADGRPSYFKGVKIKGNAFYWLVDATYRITQESIKTDSPQFSLTSEAKGILLNRGIAAFNNACGTHFYVGRRLGARYLLLYEFNSKQDQFVERLKSKADYSSFGISASTAFYDLLKKADQNSALTITSKVMGVDGKIEDYARDPEGLKKELIRLRQKIYQEKNGDTLEWTIDNYDQFPEYAAAKAKAKNQGTYNEISEDLKNNKLQDYYRLTLENNQRVYDLSRKLENASGDEPLLFYSEENKKKILAAIDAYQEHNEELRKSARNCLEDVDCTNDKLRPLDIETPNPDKDFSGFGDWHIYPMLLGNDPIDNDFDLEGDPGQEYDNHIFSGRSRLIVRANGDAFLLARNPTDNTGEVKIGILSQIADPKTGKHHLSLCTGEFSKVCQLRFIESHKECFSDGYPSTKMQLTIFDSFGFAVKKVDFLAKK